MSCFFLTLFVTSSILLCHRLLDFSLVAERFFKDMRERSGSHRAKQIVSCCLLFFCCVCYAWQLSKKMYNLTLETFCIERANIIPPLLHLTAWYNVGSSADTDVTKINNSLSSPAPCANVSASMVLRYGAIMSDL